MDDRTKGSNMNGEDEAMALEPIRRPRSTASSAAHSGTGSGGGGASIKLRRPTVKDRRQPSIRLRRLPSAWNLASSSSENTTSRDFAHPAPNQNGDDNDHEGDGHRRRSSSEPQRPPWNSLSPNDSLPRSAGRPRGFSNPMPSVDEEGARASNRPQFELDGDDLREVPPRPGMYSRAGTAARSALGLNAMAKYNDRRRANQLESHDEYEDGLVDYLDVVDPEIATLSTLTNVQNSLFIPNLGSLLNRRPTYTFTRNPSNIMEADKPTDSLERITADSALVRPRLDRSVTITSRLSETEDHYAVLPHGIRLDGWTAAEKQELNDHVRHLLHSRRAAFKRSMKGFGQYVRRRESCFHFKNDTMHRLILLILQPSAFLSHFMPF